MSTPSTNDKIVIAAAAAAGALTTFLAMKLAAKKKRRTPDHVKLTYFDFEGAGEPVRLALILAGVPFEDDRFQFAEWKDLKPKMPRGQVPVLLVDGEMKTQSGAMLRWAGSLDPSKGLYPEDKLFEVEEAMGIIGDLQRAWRPAFYIAMHPPAYGYPEDFAKTPKGQEKISSMRKSFVENELPRYLGYISEMIDRNGGKWIASSDKPTIADCLAVPALRSFTRGHVDHVDADCIKKTSPKVVRYVERFCALDGVKGRYMNGIGA